MWIRRVTLIAALAVGPTGTAPVEMSPPGVALENLRLNSEGKVQVDVVVRSSRPPADGRVDVEFTDDRGTEIVTVVRLNGADARRIATTVRSLSCGESRHMRAAVVAPEHARGSVLQKILKRQCS